MTAPELTDQRLMPWYYDHPRVQQNAERENPGGLYNLTPMQVAQLGPLADGTYLGATANCFSRATKTTDTHRSLVRSRLGACTNAQAVYMALDNGWVTFDDLSLSDYPDFDFKYMAHFCLLAVGLTPKQSSGLLNRSLPSLNRDYHLTYGALRVPNLRRAFSRFFETGIWRSSFSYPPSDQDATYHLLSDLPT